MQRLIALLALAAPAFGTVITNAQISGVGTDVVSASAQAFYLGGLGTDPGLISASTQVTGSTFGPVRPGFIQISGNGAGAYGAGTGSIGSYNFLCGEVCPLGAPVMMPFTLGVPFQIDVSADAMILGMTQGFGGIDFQFSLFESLVVFTGAQPITGARVLIEDPSTAVPEPATVAAVALGLGFLSVSRNRKSRR
jgi:hypothetical protein